MVDFILDFFTLCTIIQTFEGTPSFMLVSVHQKITIDNQPSLVFESSLKEIIAQPKENIMVIGEECENKDRGRNVILFYFVQRKYRLLLTQ
jgi:hypothetical protein